MAFITPHSQGGLGLSFPIPPLITTTPCEGLRDVTRGRDRVACAEEDGTKKSLKAAGSDGSQQWGCSSVAAWLNLGPGWLGLCAHERLQKKNQPQHKLFQQTTKRNIRWKEARH